METRFARALSGMVMFNPETSEIAKPSELLTSVRAYMNVLQCVENHVHIDITRIFNNVLLQQTQQTDSNGEATIASAYTQWYSDILLRRVSAGHICFSSTLKSFVSLTAEGAIPFNAEEFSDPSELMALTELIGPYGIRLLNETLMWHIGSQVQELKKIVLQNKEVLVMLRTNFDKPETMKELAKRLTNVDSVLQVRTRTCNFKTYSSDEMNSFSITAHDYHRSDIKLPQPPRRGSEIAAGGADSLPLRNY